MDCSILVTSCPEAGEAELRIMKEMFEASVDGRVYDNERWDNTIVRG
jgi:hypothetical protein